MKNRFLKLFLATGAPFGVFMGYSYHSFTRGIIAGVFFGFIMALCFRIVESLSLKNMGKKGSDIGVRQERKFNVPIPKEDAINKITMALNEMKAKITKDDSSNGIIEAKTQMSWKSFSEIMTIRFVQSGDQTEIFVESRPSISTAMVDCGKNLQNVEKFQELISL